MRDFRLDYGFVYEYGYTIGCLSVLHQPTEELRGRINLQVNAAILGRMTSWLQRPEQIFSLFVQAFRNKHNITDEGMFVELTENLERIFFFGYLSGKSCLQQYLFALPLQNFIKTEVVYLQGNLLDPLNRGRNIEEQQKATIHDIYHAFGLKFEREEHEYYEGKGHFLRADSIFMLKQGNQYFLLVTDNGMFLQHLENIDSPQALLRSLQRVRGEMGRKTKFSHFSMNTAGLNNVGLHDTLVNYAQAVRDKTLVKTVQAGAYAYSLLSMLEEQNFRINNCHVTLMAQSDYDYSVINLLLSGESLLKSEEGRVLAECHTSYVRKKSEEEWIVDVPLAVKELLLRNIHKHTAMDPEELSRFVKEGSGKFLIRDEMKGFQNTAGKFAMGDTLRDDHAEEVRNGLLDRDTQILYLTGNPGIGKTTAIVQELKQHERFLFLYTSCRRTVNDDIVEKFTEENKLYADDFIALSTSSVDEQKINGVPVDVVNTLINDKSRVKKSRKITYLDKHRKIDYEEGTYEFREIGNDQFIEETDIKRSGVLKRLVSGIQEQIQNPDIRKIVATFSIQALKKTRKHTTLSYFNTLFPFVRYSEEFGVRVDLLKYDAFVARYPVVWVMIDEITGTDEGIDLYQAIKRLLFSDIYLQLDDARRKVWNVKLIVADASITNKEIAMQCLHNKNRFEHSKIYIAQSNVQPEALSVQYSPIEIGSMEVRGRFINTNSYPAKTLSLQYHLLVNSVRYGGGEEKITKDRFCAEKELGDQQDGEILDLVFEKLIAAPTEQVLVYVQNIKRIEELQEAFVQRYELVYRETACEYQHYMSISSQLTASARKKALESVSKVRCVFMTSSASRGISFKKATTIISVLQPFRIEHELMEQIQLHYRMRGDTLWDIEKEKNIHFFVVDSYVHRGEDEGYQRSKMVIHLLSFITLVRSCLESRIYGQSYIGRQKLSVVPLGGKGVTPVKNSLIQDVSDCIKLLQKERNRKGNYQLLKSLEEELKRAFTNMETFTQNQIFHKGFTDKNVYQRFLTCARQNLSKLLSYNAFQPFFFVNGLLVFRVRNMVSEHVIFWTKDKEAKKRLISQISFTLKEDLTDDLRKKLSHIQEMLRFEQGSKGYIANTYTEMSSDEKRYVAYPLLGFSLFQKLREERLLDGSETFLEVLYGLARAFTDVSSVTPIIGEYQDIPFITFQSDSLEEVLTARFQKEYLLTSTETNILNLLMIGN
ncbi:MULTISPECIES: helicase-related protein [Bacillus]|uniref:helicase-related protein n=1 Tax=Bacillus TaxID=1386 RepID=UPI000935A8D3|nr:MULTISPECIES: helicase-related protein [Bacillus]OKA31563.1 hypothetical protein BJR05_00015 [Bacillus cereus]PRP92330.1 hypothetical protein TUN_49640 [Bacillus sp. M21]